MDSNVQGQVMEDKLGVGIVGGDVKHVSPALSGSQYIDCRSKAATGGKNGDRVFKAPGPQVGTAGEKDKKADKNQQNMPQVAMEGQAPVNVAETFRDSQGGDAA